MLTPQNFREKTFEKAIFGGYDMGAVDDFLEEAASDYAAIAKENMVLKSKMKVLVEKIEEYRATEDSMRLTLLSVQKLTAQIEKEAREKSETVVSAAHDEAERITREAYTQRATEEARLLEAKRESTQYIENMRLLCSKQLNFLDGLGGLKLEDLETPAPAEAPAVTVEETVRSIENSVERLAETGDGDSEIRRIITSNAEAPTAETENSTRMFSASAPTPAQPQVGQFTFDNLRFGK
ncbi:MAG: DivIVA domain-containing protein [Oscillospiraceae bacterium]